MRERYKEDIDRFLSEVKISTESLQRRLYALYQIELSQLEVILVAENLIVVNFLRKARGLPQIEEKKSQDQSTPPPQMDVT